MYGGPCRWVLSGGRVWSFRWVCMVFLGGPILPLRWIHIYGPLRWILVLYPWLILVAIYIYIPLYISVHCWTISAHVSRQIVGCMLIIMCDYQGMCWDRQYYSMVGWCVYVSAHASINSTVHMYVLEHMLVETILCVYIRVHAM